MDVKAYLKDVFENQFECFYGRKPTKEQTEVYMRYCLGKEKDSSKVIGVCQIDHVIGKLVDRGYCKRRFNFIFGFDPDEEELDVFVSYQLRVISDLDVLWEVKKSRKQVLSNQNLGPTNE